MAEGNGAGQYLSVANFWKYQNADVWKKSRTHPPWFKHWVHRDRELDQLDPVARLLFYELLSAATRNRNVLEADLSWLYAETRVEPELIREHLPALLKGGWLSQTKTARRSRKLSRENRDDPLEPSRERKASREPRAVMSLVGAQPDVRELIERSLAQ